MTLSLGYDAEMLEAAEVQRDDKQDCPTYGPAPSARTEEYSHRVLMYRRRHVRK